MIIVIHSLYFVIKFALKWYRKQKALIEFRKLNAQFELEQQQQASEKHALPLDPEECFVFPTPVYRQRYSTVQDVLLDQRWRKDIKCVVDFGCAEFGFFQYVKHLLGITSILEVDIDEVLLKENKFRVQPLTADYLKQRTDPLVVEILSGSIADPDWRLKNVDAVVAIELIEHLYPDTLDALPYNVFGYCKPKIAIFTTPNSDFNVLFPNFKGFRHDDHKFEWSRAQFEEWAQSIVTRFPDYSVTFAGIGKGPQGTESLGCCSQMAVFVKEYDIMTSEVPELAAESQHLEVGSSSSSSSESFGVCTHYSYSLAHRALMADDLFNLKETTNAFDDHCDSCNQTNTYYKTLDVIKYPYAEDSRNPEEKMLHEATYQILRHATCTSRYYNEENCMVEIPLYELVKNFEGHFATEAEIRNLLVSAKFKIAECVLNGSEERCLCVQYDIEMDGNTSSKAGSDYEPSSDLNDDDDDNESDVHSGRLHHHKHIHHRNINSSNDSDWEELDESQRIKVVNNKEEIATPSDPLVDSGYQKSLSNAEWSPQSPLDGHFDDPFVVAKLDVNDIKDSIKGPAAALFTTTVGGFSGAASTKAAKSPTATAGTSDASRRRRKAAAALARKAESDDAAEDVRCIADLLMYNSLNKLDVGDEPVLLEPDLEHDARRPQELALDVPQFIVENGDLANNNRDLEGNNYPDEDVLVPLIIDVDAEHDPNENRNAEEHNQDQANRNVRMHPHPIIEYVVEVPPVAQHRQQHKIVVGAAVAAAVAVVDGDDDDDVDEEIMLNHASREALFDPNSQVDMLDDVGSMTDENVDFETETDTTDADVENIDTYNEEPVIPDNNPFPNWLLQLFGGTYGGVQGGDDVVDDDVNQDEAHFYCQGDGLGVHPSIAEVDVESSSESLSTDEAQAERTISEDDVGSLPTDAVTPTSPTLEVVGQALELPYVLLNQGSNMSNDSGGEEFYDTIDEQSSERSHS